MVDIAKETLIWAAILPIIWYLLKYMIGGLSKKIDEIKLAVWKHVLEDEFIVDYAKTKVWFASEEKLKFIKERLTKNHLRDRENQVKRSITSELQRRTEEYVEYLNKFNTRVWLVWDYISENFEWDDFMKEVFDVIFRKPKKDEPVELTNEYKINDIKFLMIDYQTKLFKKFNDDLKKV